MFNSFFRIFAVFIVCLLISNCKDSSGKSFHIGGFPTDSIFAPRLKPVKISEQASNKLREWPQFESIKESVVEIGEDNIYSTESNIQKKKHNDTYYSLYYKIYALYESIEMLSVSKYPSYLDNKAVHIRIALLKTYVSRLKYQMETNKVLSNTEIIKNIDDIFDSYNGVISEIGREYQRKLNDNIMDNFFLGSAVIQAPMTSQ